MPPDHVSTWPTPRVTSATAAFCSSDSNTVSENDKQREMEPLFAQPLTSAAGSLGSRTQTCTVCVPGPQCTRSSKGALGDGVELYTPKSTTALPAACALVAL